MDGGPGTADMMTSTYLVILKLRRREGGGEEDERFQTIQRLSSSGHTRKATSNSSISDFSLFCLGCPSSTLLLRHVLV